MKKIILMGAVLVSSMMTAQITVTGNDGEAINNGDVYMTTTLTPQATSQLELHVTNDSPNTMRLQLRVDSMINTFGESVQFCFGDLCFFDVEPGKVVPPAGKVLAPGASNNDEDHFWNYYAGANAGENVGFVLSFIEIDDAGNIIGDPLLTFGYTYSPTGGTNDLNGLTNMGINVKNTLVKNTLDIDATIAANLEVLDVNGKLVKGVALSNGANAADLSSLNAGVYIARFTTSENKISQIRIIKN